MFAAWASRLETPNSALSDHHPGEKQQNSVTGEKNKRIASIRRGLETGWRLEKRATTARQGAPTKNEPKLTGREKRERLHR